MRDLDLPSYEELKRTSYARHDRDMGNAFILAAISAVVSAFSVSDLVIFSRSMSVLLFVLSIFGAVIPALVTVGAIFMAGCQYKMKQLTSLFWEKEGQYQKLNEDSNEEMAETLKHAECLLEEFVSLALFIDTRAPELFAEFLARGKAQSQSPVGDKN